MKLKIIFLFIILVCYSYQANANYSDVAKPFIKEELVYDIKQMGVRIGEAKLRYENFVQKDGQTYFLVTFTANAFRFYDEEKIYLDKETFHPVIVERVFQGWGKDEKIVEKYSKETGQVKIIKQSKGEETIQEINKNIRLENIYGFILRYRCHGSFNIGDSTDLSLPTKDIKIKLIEETKVKAMEEEHDAYYMQSTPKGYKIWFDKSDQKIPLKIKGSVGINKTTLVLREYNNPNKLIGESDE